MPNNRSLYLVPRMLDAKTRIIGLTLDEFLPASLLGAFLFFSGRDMLAIAMSVIVVMLVKIMKRGQGVSWLVNACYWYLPGTLSWLVINKTPPSKDREYIA